MLFLNQSHSPRDESCLTSPGWRVQTQRQSSSRTSIVWVYVQKEGMGLGLGPEQGKRDVGQVTGKEMLPQSGVGEDASISLFLSFAKGTPNTMVG